MLKDSWVLVLLLRLRLLLMLLLLSCARCTLQDLSLEGMLPSPHDRADDRAGCKEAGGGYSLSYVADGR